MNSMLVCVIVGAVLAAAEHMPPEIVKMMEEHAIKCQPKTGVTNDEMALMMQKAMPTSREGFCFMACMKKEFGIMMPDNTFDLVRMEQIATPFKAMDPEIFASAVKIAKMCNDEVKTTEDECEVIKAFANCAVDKAKEMGIPDLTVM